MMSREITERLAIAGIIALTIGLLISAPSLNDRSFNQILSYVHAVKSDVGNLREKASVESGTLIKMYRDDVVELENIGKPFLKVTGAQKIFIPKKSGSWYKAKHISSSKEGWIHQSILRRYVHIGYYDHFEIDKSLFEVSW